MMALYSAQHVECNLGYGKVATIGIASRIHPPSLKARPSVLCPVLRYHFTVTSHATLARHLRVRRRCI